MTDTDAALLSRLLFWRVVNAAPADERSPDVSKRLRLAGVAFRRHTRPLRVDEVSDAANRLRAEAGH